jgi:hypothetical protein
MVTLAQKIEYLYPSAINLLHFEVTSVGGVESITKWNIAVLGALPAQAALDAVTDEQVATARDAKEPDLAALRAQAAQAVADITSYLAIADSATQAQVRAEVKAIDQRQRAVIKALSRLAAKVV